MTSVALKPLDRQVIVITGASSGIGLATARLAAKRGARVVLAARSAGDLERIAAEIREGGGEAAVCAADVAEEAQVRRIAEVARERFGGFDTWVNNAGVSAYGRLERVPIEDHRRIFETNYWGVVHGSLVALEHLRGKGGAIINLGSVLSDVAFPLQGPYSASKHALKGFSEALRMELDNDGVPVSITVVKPAAIDTPYEQHAANYLDVEPQNPPPYYTPDVVARAILRAAERPIRDLYVGGAGAFLAAVHRLAPGLSERTVGALVARLEQTGRPPEAGHDGLHAAAGGVVERGRHALALRHSTYSWARLHPVLALSLGLLAAASLVAVARARS